MKAVLRLTLAYFDVVPLQRVLNALGVLLLLVALLVGFTADSTREGQLATGIAATGLWLFMLTPIFSAAVAMRIASTRSMLNLRPHGRVRMLAAATLLITLLAAMVTMPFMVGEWADSPRATRIGALTVFEIAWTVLALGWICIFALSRSMHTLGLMGLLPVLVLGIGRSGAAWIPEPAWLLAIAVVAWALFGRWYLRAGYVTRPVLVSSPSMDSSNNAPLQWLLSILPERDLPPSRERATFLFLLGGTPAFFALTGAWMGLLFLAIHFIPAAIDSGERRHSSLLQMLPFLAFFPAAFALNIVRRGRMLWLRGGRDRGSLFRVAELLGLRSAVTTWAIAAAVVILVVLLADPRSPGFVMLYAAAQAAVAVCLFYAGLSLINAWSVRDVLLCVGLSLAVIVQFIALEPHKRANVDIAIGVLVIATVVALVLRWRAARAWARLDWRVARLPQVAVRTG